MNDNLFFDCRWCGYPLYVELPTEKKRVNCSACQWSTPVPEVAYPLTAETQDIKHGEWITRCKGD